MNIDWLRSSLIVGMIAVAFLLILRWSDFQERELAKQAPDSSSQIVRNSSPTSNFEESSLKAPNVANHSEQNDDFDLPEAPQLTNKVDVDTVKKPAASLDQNNQLIHVRSDTHDVLIDPVGGDLIQLSLIQYYQKLNEADLTFPILRSTNTHTYIARSGLVGSGGIDGRKQGRPLYRAEKKRYELNEDQDTLVVDLHYKDSRVSVIKRFTFTRDSYVIDIDYIVTNSSNEILNVSYAGSIKRDSSNPNRAAGLGMAPFLGAATTTIDTNYDKYDFGDIAEKPVKHAIQGGWVAMVQHYFMSAWIPDPELENSYTIRKHKNDDIYFMSFASATNSINPTQQLTLSARFYAGPKDVGKLEDISPHLELTVDYGILWWIAKPIFFALKFIQNIVVNWGVAIIVLTLFIKLVFLYPSAMSYRSMANMKKIQPKLVALKERCGDDKQKYSAEMMKLYRTEKINPVSGCLPILIQMPVFMALYWVLMESVELRHAPFFLWIHDLSVKDPFFILPLVMGFTMWIQQKFNPPQADPTMAKMMQLMPIFFTVLCLFFPAGLVLYWVVNNTLTIAQQYFITKQIEKGS